MVIDYKDITFNSLMVIIDLFPEYDFICDGDKKIIYAKEKTHEKNR